MLRLAADENFNQHIVNGLRRQLPDIDVLTVRTAGLKGTPDPGVLAWAARDGRVLVVKLLEPSEIAGRVLRLPL